MSGSGWELVDARRRKRAWGVGGSSLTHAGGDLEVNGCPVESDEPVLVGQGELQNLAPAEPNFEDGLVIRRDHPPLAVRLPGELT